VHWRVVIAGIYRQGFCLLIGMSLKFSSALSFVVLTSCLNDVDPQRIEKWHLYSYVGSSGCFFPDDGIVEEHNYIIETLLGLEDSTIMKIELHLDENGEMKILKDNQVALSGNWKILDQRVLTLTSGGERCKFDVANKHADSLVLKSDGYQYMQDLEIVFKH
jgi:hypothetical protein